jgi:hypothetical protein
MNKRWRHKQTCGVKVQKYSGKTQKDWDDHERIAVGGSLAHLDALLKKAAGK